jgi:hypothetical protein
MRDMTQNPTLNPYDALSEREIDEIHDMLYMQADEIAEGLGLTPDPETLRFSEEDQEKITWHCRDIVMRHRDDREPGAASPPLTGSVAPYRC